LLIHARRTGSSAQISGCDDRVVDGHSFELDFDRQKKANFHRGERVGQTHDREIIGTLVAQGDVIDPEGDFTARPANGIDYSIPAAVSEVAI